MIDEILSLVKAHEKWRGSQCLNLIPSENIMSPTARSLLSSDLGHRYTSKDSFYTGTYFLDEIEAFGEKLAKEVFKAETADLRPLSGHIADLIFVSCFAKPGDTIMCVAEEDGGYPGLSVEGLPSLLQLNLVHFPFSKERMNIMVDEAAEAIKRTKPKLVIFGASCILFPHPVQELAHIACDSGAHVGFDGSHVLGLIAGGQFQDPLREGAQALFGSTHKSFFGPQGGIILADEEHGNTMKSKIFPRFVDNAHWNRIAALTLALAEMKMFGEAYARQVVRNSKALAKALHDFGLPVRCSSLGFTESHQVVMDFGNMEENSRVAEKLEQVNIIVDRMIRLGTCEVTRRGMKEAEMETIAEFIKRIVIDGEDPESVKGEVIRFCSSFQEICFCFKT
ncbi:hypothetical protein H5T51_07530 [Candidatus Bathyarchaeota archaeon]|nr:hypothetical protein [Candidatus Bathyarchaeota archaeon]